MTIVLRRPVMVAGTPGRELKELPAGTPLDSIAEIDVAQLHPDHFVDVDADGERTGKTAWAGPLEKKLSKLAADLRELDGTPGVDSKDFVDPEEAEKS